MSENRTDALIQGGWEPNVHRALEKFLSDAPGGGAPVVFDFDNTCILGDIGELFGHFLVEAMGYRYDLDGFWDLVHLDDGRQELREITEAAFELPEAERQSTPIYERYLAEMAGLYGRRLNRVGKRDCYEWAVRLHVGLTEEEMTTFSRAAIRQELARHREIETFRTERGEQVEIERGVRPFQEVRELMRALDAAGFAVWIVSASNIWTVRVFAEYFGIPADRVLGNRVEVEGGRLTDRIRSPALFREGKVATIEREIGARPVFAAGDADTDYEMLCQARDLSLVIDRGDELLRRGGAERGWAIQQQRLLTTEEPA